MLFVLAAVAVLTEARRIKKNFTLCSHPGPPYANEPSGRYHCYHSPHDSERLALTPSGTEPGLTTTRAAGWPVSSLGKVTRKHSSSYN